MASTVYDRGLFSAPEFAIFFDNVRMDQFVSSWNTQGNVEGGIGSASLEMIYVPDLYRTHSANKTIKVGSKTIKTSSESGDGIENMTNLRIFVKNVFTQKYCCIFDGNIKAKSLTRTGSGMRLTFSASDYMTWFNKTIVPLAIPTENKLSFPDRMRWKAQGINLDEIPTVTEYGALHFRGKNIEQMWDEITEKTMKINMLYAKSEVAAWDNALGRVIHMADIDPKYTKEQSALDFVVTASASSVNSIYVLMNDLIKSVLMEFYQDGDGQVKIKAPFWSEPVLKKHVIDPAMIVNFNESVNFDAEFSRVVATGGLEWWQENDEEAESFLTPTAVYRSDGTFSTSEPGSDGAGEELLYSNTGDTTGTWLDHYNPPTSRYGMRTLYGQPDFHEGRDYGMSIGTKIKHIGPKGEVVVSQDLTTGFGKHVVVEILAGKFQGYKIYYAHLNQRSVSVGQIVSENDEIGYSGNTGKSTGPHLHFSTRNASGEWQDPMIYLVAASGSRTVGNYSLSIGDDALLDPTDFEKKYGPSIYSINQPMIKFSNAADSNNNRQSMFDMLKEYAKFMLQYLNSGANIATLQTIAMPWIRMGFNIWVDPLGIDRIYYVSSISFQGSSDGAYTSFGLTMGRTSSDFTNGKASIASLKPDASPHVFINQFNEGYHVSNGDFGAIVGKVSGDYTSFKSMALKFHMGISTQEGSLINAASSKYFQSLYGQNTVVRAIGGKKNTKKENSKPIDPSSWKQTLQRGSSGADVRELQTLLDSLGYNIGSDGVDGKFGSDTASAVVAFQAANNLKQDGKVGPNTRKALSQKKTKNVSLLSECTIILKRGNKGKYVTALQELLIKLDFAVVGGADGDFGRNTEKAVKDFQGRKRLEPDGIVGPKTKAALLA